MSRPFSSVTAAAIASIAAMVAFVLWSGSVHWERAQACTACVGETAMREGAGKSKPLGLIDL